MAHKFPNVLVHLVFSTKERRGLIPADLQPRLWKYIGGIGANRNIPILTCGGTDNHLHVLISLPSDITVTKIVQVLKANSSRWIAEHGTGFEWQEGYGAFSVSASNLGAVHDYIDHQSEHHAKRSYEDEFVAMLRKSGVAFDAADVFG